MGKNGTDVAKNASDMILATSPINTVTISPIFVAIKKWIAFFILSYMFLPCLTVQ